MKKYIFSLFAALALVSCTEYLDIKPYGKEIPEDVEDFSALLHHLCDDIDNGNTLAGPIMGLYSDAGALEAVTDNMEVNLTESPGGDMLRGYIGHFAVSTSYTNLYEAIRTCNIVLDEIGNARDTREGLDLIGTAYAIRGVCYYQLMRHFCAPPLAEDGTLGVPIVTTFDMEAKPVRSTMQETIDQIERDFKAAIECDIQEPMYRFNSDIMHGYLARLYHWCGRWQEARDEALQVLAKHPLIEGDDYKAMINKQFGLAGNRLIMSNIYGSTLILTSYYNTLKARPISVRYINLFPASEADIRKTFFFNAKRQSTKTCFAGMRSAEMAFIAMEAAYHLGNPTTALKELNDFRRKRISPYTDLTMTTLPAIRDDEYIKEDCNGNVLTPLLYNILTERRKEFFMENADRFYELKRNGRPEWWIMYRGLKYWNQKFMYTWPLPITDIELQPGLIQNPGYDEAI